ncbi:hypothetical protein GCM10025868_17940 [Angustibacter aerolatus]|uniref:Uncharacterized protein n=1 Tax=Angustibacter aerolatus TaxID=1162965 RepID=A0ABQ6JGN0_9ACTN|nr:hypothetical protein [Angustibacter aerolatus]GMA86544.1 hypothetical protein GCM10025868_17940 [Angustibacter aerolatus]
MAKWEYATVPLIVHATKQILDQWGEDGWEPGAGRDRRAGQPRRLPQARARVVSAVEDRLAELGLTLPDVVPPLAAYVPAVRQGDLVWTAGQLPLAGGQARHHRQGR